MELLSTLDECSLKKKCTKRKLLSLIGVLSFAANVVKLGRTFLRRLIDLSTVVSHLHHHISLNKDAGADIAWWQKFLPTWNRGEMFQEDIITSVDLFFFTDASDIGMGGSFRDEWFSIRWPRHLSWAKKLSSKQILFYCDNETVVEILNAGCCKSSKMIMKVVRKLFYVCARHNISLRAEHIPGL